MRRPWLEVDYLVGHALLPSLLSTEPVVVDLGANHGEFSHAMHATYGARCIAVEPNPRLAAALRDDNKIEQLFEVAIGADRGRSDLAIAAKDDASRLDRTPGSGPEPLDTVSVETVDLDHFLDQLALPRIDVLKVDVEGLEIAGLLGVADDRWAGISQVTVEFHDAQGYVGVAEVQQVVQRLAAVGFRCYRASTRDYSDTLFVRASDVGAARLGLTWLRDVPIRGMWRAGRRKLASPRS